jgi:hypothetical protein
MGDFLVFTTPVVVGPLGPVTVTGDEAGSGFKSPFSVTYGAGGFTLICNSLTSVSAREINLYIDHTSGFSLIIPGGDYSGYGAQYSHYARGSLSTIGILSNYHMGVQYTLDSQPISLNHPGPYIDGAVGISSCPFDTPCTLDLQIYIHKPLMVGEMLALTHPSFKVTAGLMVGGNGSAFFGSYFRDADSTYKLQLGSTDVQVPVGSYIRSTGDRSFLKTNVALPASANASISGVLVSSIPRILKVLVSDGSDVVYPGEVLFITVIYDEPVVVLTSLSSIDEKKFLEQGVLTLLLNTFERAIYFDGGGTTSLRFIYRPLYPVEVLALVRNIDHVVMIKYLY